jgi:hypothetical protein
MPVRQKYIEKQTLVVLDILIHRAYEEIDLQGFYSRIQSVINSVKKEKRKILPIIVFAEIDSKLVKNKIHKLGFISFDLSAVYGSNISKVIKNLFYLKSDKHELSGIEYFKAADETLNFIKAAGQDENLKNIKGDLFEYLMYPLLYKLYNNSSIEHGKKLIIKNSDKSKDGFEYDFIITSPDYNEVTIVELKGYSSNAKISLGDSEIKNTVSWFFSKTFPFAKKIYKNQLNNPKVTASFITCAGFMTEAIDYMNKLNVSKIKPTKLDTWYDRDKLFAVLENNGLKKIKETINKYYSDENILS